MRYIDQTESSSSSSATATPALQKKSYQKLLITTTKFEIANSEVLPIVSKQNLKTTNNKTKIELGMFLILKICIF